jgi:5-methylcytosine-specific restriction endonuclease McrA
MKERYRDDFLYTPEWRVMRLRVLKRAQNLCESCLEAAATEVHHVTYENGLMPPAWLLRAVCTLCHDRLHKPDEDAARPFDADLKFE